MSIGQILRRRARHVIAPMIGALLVAYFGYHAVQGDRGLLAYLQLTQEIKKAQLSLELFRADRELIERRVALLRPEGIEPDMLDERVRVMLNFAHKDEVVIMLQRAEAASPVITAN
jgi:cell division protein FtsB